MDDELNEFIKAAINDAALASVHYKTLCREGVEPKYAAELTAAWILSRGKKETITTEIIEPKRQREDWEPED